MTPATLPATELPIPDLDWSIASYKGHPTSDGFAYVASLRRNGKKVASVEHDGRGGTVMVFWTTAAKEHRQAWNRWVADYQSLHPENAAYEPESTAVESLIDEYEVAAKLRRATRRETPVLRPGESVLSSGGFTALRGLPDSPEVKAFLRKPDHDFDRFWDGKRWVKL
ncbi:hypothetical protein RBB84_18795 [Rhodococcus sp. D-6]|uniref:Uncharacterized protein n=1 Tax=Rhodococcus sp. D-6 TaxID=1387842 RepID=A0AAU7UTW1_9NOCA|nr:hypothetical protein [Rhodococcus sp. PD04]WSE25761.1 hypothetical protein U9J23_27480 [Rhodococcus sp. PD04]